MCNNIININNTPSFTFQLNINKRLFLFVETKKQIMQMIELFKKITTINSNLNKYFIRH